MWRLYYTEDKITHLTVESLPGDYIELDEATAMEFHTGKRRYIDWLVVDRKLVVKPDDTTIVFSMPVFVDENTTGRIYDVVELDPSWVSDSSIKEKSRVIFKWLK
jgi:hypothetical protein